MDITKWICHEQFNHCTDFSIIIKFSQILGGGKLNLGGGNPRFPPLCMKPCFLLSFVKNLEHAHNILLNASCQYNRLFYFYSLNSVY